MNEVKAYFEKMASTWDQTCDCPGVKHMAVAHLAGVSDGSRVLDIGCGTGIMEPALFANGAKEVVAIDLSYTMVEIASQKYCGLPVTFEQVDIIDFARQTDVERFDVAVIYNAYPHFSDKASLVEAVRQVLVPGGRFLVAHGAGKETINKHHHVVPENVTTGLKSAEEESALWRALFDIDSLVDAPFFFCFGGTKR